MRALRDAPKVVISPGRTHKAGNAEAILKTCLKRLGLTKRYAAGKLTTNQHKTLLQAIRMEGRAWLRHEAIQFARAHFGYTPVPRGVPGGFCGDDGDDPGRVGPIHGQGDRARGLDWVPEPGGFLHLQEADPVLKGGIKRLFGRLRNYVRELIVAGAMAILGPSPLTGEDLAAAEADVALQEQFLDKFEDDIEANVPHVMDPNQPPTGGPTPPTPAQFVARVEKYADSTWRAAQKASRKAAVANPQFKAERRVLGHPKTQHCEDCPPLADMSWQPLGTLPDIGDTECGPLCLCHFRYLGTDGKEYFSGKSGPLPAPADGSEDEIGIEEDDGGTYPVAGPPVKA